MVFISEKEMVEVIKKSEYINNLITHSPSLIKEEVEGFFGIPDIVVVNTSNGIRKSYAYEAKLKNWQRAIVQAFRYKAFVNISCVIMDHDHINPALSQYERFVRSNVGLMSIDDSGEVYCHYRPYEEIPYSPSTEFKFNKMVMSELQN